MPGYDGTGPQGRGPMTGGGGGFCLLKLPRSPDEALTGFAGRAGYPVRIPSPGMGSDLESFRAQLWNVERAIHSIQRRVAALEGTPTETGDFDHEKAASSE